jgi:ACR3 family arsenite transporter
VPAMLAVANVVNRTRAWYEAKPGVPDYAQCCPPGVSGAPTR